MEGSSFRISSRSEFLFKQSDWKKLVISVNWFISSIDDLSILADTLGAVALVFVVFVLMQMRILNSFSSCLHNRSGWDADKVVGLRVLTFLRDLLGWKTRAASALGTTYNFLFYWACSLIIGGPKVTDSGEQPLPTSSFLFNVFRRLTISPLPFVPSLVVDFMDRSALAGGREDLGFQAVVRFGEATSACKTFNRLMRVHMTWNERLLIVCLFFWNWSWSSILFERNCLILLNRVLWLWKGWSNGWFKLVQSGLKGAEHLLNLCDLVSYLGGWHDR